MTTIEFFHDAVCGWCYLLSPRLRHMASRYRIKIIHRAYVLQRNNQEMITRFGSLEQAKTEILEHWKHCQSYAEDPDRFNIEGMQHANFDYPTGLNAAIASKSAEILGGQLGHWNYFDATQTAHLKENRNISDIRVLFDIAESIGFSPSRFSKVFYQQETREAVNQDNARARVFGIQSIPSMLVNGHRLISQTLSNSQLEALFNELQIEFNGENKCLSTG